MAGNWLIYEKGDDVKSVKVGYSWWGLLFGWLWMLEKKLRLGYIWGSAFGALFVLLAYFNFKAGNKNGFGEVIGLWLAFEMLFGFFSGLQAFTRGWTLYRKKLEKEGYTLKPEAVSVSISPAPQESPAKGQADRLRELDKLHKDGILTDAEFQEKRKVIIDSM